MHFSLRFSIDGTVDAPLTHERDVWPHIVKIPEYARPLHSMSVKSTAQVKPTVFKTRAMRAARSRSVS